MTQMLTEIKHEPQTLIDLEKNNKDTLIQLVKELKKRSIHHVTLAARGTSDHASIFGQYMMGALGGIVAGLATPSVTTLYGGKIDFSDSLVIACSQSGAAADALAVVEQAKACGGLTLAITNFTDSPLAKTADFHLWCSTAEEKSVAATKTFTAELALYYLLCAYWFDRDDLKADYTKLIKAVDEMVNNKVEEIREVSKAYRYIKDGFVLSRGTTYPIALEQMLKVQETCYIKMKGYSAADFVHGPLAQIDFDTPVLIYAIKGAAEKDNEAMYNRILGVGAHPLMITDDEALAGKYGENAFLIPDAGNEWAAPIVMASFAQIFAETLCAHRSMNPDAPRNLQKVTVTK